jgi:carotenoid 1,2-hydratase
VHQGGLRFDCAIAANGYVWWYLDALSDDGKQGVTVIAFIGSVFSPYYAWARRGGLANPLNHCALNVAIYQAGNGRWAMTERGIRQLDRQATSLSIGPSTMRWTGEALEIGVAEICAPLPRRLRGVIRLFPSTLCQQSFALHPNGLHRWTPFAPCARVEVQFSEPKVSWAGMGYLDSNIGDEPIENGFEAWTWSRASAPGRTSVLYDTRPRNEAPRGLALTFSPQGEAQHMHAPPLAQLPNTGWRLPRQTRSDAGHEVRVLKTLEDAPFYSRTLIDARLFGVREPAIHESLSLDRFRSRWVQCLLPFRMPRITL